MASQNGIDNQITDNDFTVTNNDCGATAFISCTNSCTDASSDSVIEAVVASATAGDPFINFEVSGVTDWSLGIDNSVTSPAADPFLISANSALGTNTVMTAQTTGELNYPLQPCFSAYLSADMTNATGDGTNVTVTFNSEEMDIGSNFNTSTYTFTSPVAGNYFFNSSMALSGLLGTHTFGQHRFISTATSHTAVTYNPANFFGVSGTMVARLWASCIIPMDAGDTVYFTIQVDLGTKVVEIVGGIDGCFLQGYLLS